MVDRVREVRSKARTVSFSEDVEVIYFHLILMTQPCMLCIVDGFNFFLNVLTYDTPFTKVPVLHSAEL